MLLAIAVSARAQRGAHVAADAAAQTPAVSTNPTYLFRSLSLDQEFDRLPLGLHTYTTTLSYTEPFRHAANSLGISIPFATAKPALPTGNNTAANTAANAGEPLTLSDITLKSQWIPYLAVRQGVLLTSSLTLPTSEDDRIGDGKWMITPSVAYARFPGPRLLIAQFFQQQVSFAGPATRAAINRSDLDLYSVYSSRSLRWWINADLNLRIDEANHNRMPSSVTISYGRGLRTMLGGSLNASVRSGAGIGRDRPYDFIVAAGISLVGIHRSR